MKETTGVSGYTVSYNNGEYQYASNDGTITNTLNETNIKIVKVDANNNATRLTGAIFKLEKKTAPDTWTVVENNNNVVVDANGEATIINLADGTYWLTETQAPAGYNMLSAPIQFTIKNGIAGAPTDNTIEYKPVRAAVEADPENGTEAQEAVTIAAYIVPNTPGTELPSTGGPGIALYTFAGLALMSAAFWLVIRRRREQN